MFAIKAARRVDAVSLKECDRMAADATIANNTDAAKNSGMTLEKELEQQTFAIQH